MTTPNIFTYATSELSQDATFAYILAWADPTYNESHPHLHALGTELLRSLLSTQTVKLPQIKTLHIETQVGSRSDRIDILVRINADKNFNRIILIIEDKVNAPEHSSQIERYKKFIEERYSGSYDNLVAVYLKTGNESRTSFPPKAACGRFLRPDILNVLNKFRDTGNVIVDDFRTHLQKWEDDTNRWQSLCYRKWGWTQREGFYTALESQLSKNCGWDCGWGYIPNPAGGFLACWLGYGDLWIRTQDRFANLYMQIHDATRLTVRLGSGNALDKVHGLFMWAVFDALNQVNTETSNDFRIEKAGIFRGGGAAAVADITFGDRDTWLAVDEKGIVNMDASIEHLHLVAELLRKVAKCDELLKHVE